MTDNAIQSKSKAFSLKIINLYDELTQNKEFIMSKQILRSGTSIGANAAESQGAQSKADFYSKLNISLKEAYETCYWLELLSDSGRISKEKFYPLHNDCKELMRILIAITKNQSMQKNKPLEEPKEPINNDDYDEMDR